MTIAEFWIQQPFNFIATYSFNRAPELPAAIQQLKDALVIARFMRQAALRHRLHRLTKSATTLGEELAGSYSTAVQVAIIQLESSAGQHLSDLCRRGGAQTAWAGCVPTYRDALVFCDAQGQQLRVLNICFSCSVMQTDDGTSVEADMATYEQLRAFLIQLGHPISDES